MNSEHYYADIFNNLQINLYEMNNGESAEYIFQVSSKLYLPLKVCFL